MPQRISPLAPFQYKTFRALWSATLVSNLGGLVQTVGAGWMMATIAHSDDMVALVQASTTLPVMIFSVAAGALADNFDRRRIMLTAQVLLLIISVALAAFAYLGILTPWMLLSFTFLIGCGGALHNPSWQASMGDIVPRTDLPAAVALNSMSFNLMRSIGPAIGGIIVAAAGAAFAFIFNAFSYCALILALWQWKPETVKSTLPRETLGPAMVAGLRYVAMSPNLLKVMFRGFLFGLSAIVILALLPLSRAISFTALHLPTASCWAFSGLAPLAAPCSVPGFANFLAMNGWCAALSSPLRSVVPCCQSAGICG